MLNKETINRLIELNKKDIEMLDFIKSCLDTFEQYHKAVIEDQTFLLIYSGSSIDSDEYRERRTVVDRIRTLCHNGLLSSVNKLNILAKNEGLAPVYDGIVSEDRQYRRKVADSVFEYIEYIINNRS